ncbi:D-alanyl-D-alanine carboxypeptidase [Cohnella sp. CIP 111063]|uniref:D-alanyl-D-alanine carboxypeptidase family protein n=1 Tax=unclassified Cohnella TaxID=2636738 RepID=UPI000B8BC051|nr:MULTISPECIES: D-alanyl-D-alanine carboxypeptidase family protein [unclassified Cohnella]OXS52183.1 D-alanyl-D-alanine carboxypeptidase [Cohnella sp. CIP 111063]PRX53605.1 D-alanyl-D-alanine carboxypeptidase (penicillin-binding protein 5/6) [Cohnella sp. SGD-V74]
MNRHHQLSLSLAFLSKRFVAAVVLASFLLLFGFSSFASADELPAAPQLEAEAAILMDAESGQILFQHNADEARPPASMAKMMTEYLVSMAVKQGKMSWDDKVTVGENAAKQTGSRILLAQGDQHTIRELYIALAVYSANDATVQLAEEVSGSEEEFAKLMNQTAVEFGMTQSHFINSTGLDRADMPEKFRPTTVDGETTMSARDAAILAYRIVKDDPEFLETSKLQEYKFRERDKTPMKNWNWMLGTNKDNPTLRKFAYEGVDGLKTGHTSRAGQNFTGTALRNGTRLIGVVMGVPGTTEQGKRFLETAKLFDYGFKGFEKKTIVEAKASVPEHETLKIKKGKSTTVSVVTATDLTVLIPKGVVVEPVVQEVKPVEDPLVAPIAQGDKVGTVTYKYKDPSTQEEKTVTIDLIASEEVNKASWWRLLFRAIGNFFSGLFQGIVDLF